MRGAREGATPGKSICWGTGAGGSESPVPPPQDIVIQQDDEIRLKIVGTRVDKNDIVSLWLPPHPPPVPGRAVDFFLPRIPWRFVLFCRAEEMGGQRPGAKG